MLQSTNTPEILDSMVSAILVTDDELKLQYMNQAAEELLGNSFLRFKDVPVDQILENPKLKTYIQQAISALQSQLIREDQFVIGLNGTIHVDYAITPLTKDDEITGLLFEISQIDRQIRIARETQIINTQATNQSVLRGIAHEIKNPLGGLRGAAQLLEIEIEDEAVKEYTQIIISEADRLTKLVDNMLGSSQRPQKTWVNIHEVLEHARSITIAENTKGLSISTNYDPSIPEIKGDRDQLVQIVLNLLNNAVRSMKGNGEIQILTRVLRNFTVRTSNHPLVLSVKITDNGPGVPEDLKDKIFFPMITGHADGTGLGLSIAQSLINQHNGLIEFESEPGRTRFNIIIPIGE